jgi:hypothetical protein
MVGRGHLERQLVAARQPDARTVGPYALWRNFCRAFLPPVFQQTREKDGSILNSHTSRQALKGVQSKIRIRRDKIEIPKDARHGSFSKNARLGKLHEDQARQRARYHLRREAGRSARAENAYRSQHLPQGRKQHE